MKKIIVILLFCEIIGLYPCIAQENYGIQANGGTQGRGRNTFNLFYGENGDASYTSYSYDMFEGKSTWFAMSQTYGQATATIPLSSVITKKETFSKDPSFQVISNSMTFDIKVGSKYL